MVTVRKLAGLLAPHLKKGKGPRFSVKRQTTTMNGAEGSHLK